MIKASYPAYGLDFMQAIRPKWKPTKKHPKTKNKQSFLSSCPLYLRVGVKNCNGADRGPCCEQSAQHPRLYSLAAYQTLGQVPAALLVDGFYTCTLPVWVWGVLSHIPNGMARAERVWFLPVFGGAL
jgi:hypothetical protein